MKSCDCLVYGLGVVHVHYTINNTDSDVYLQRIIFLAYTVGAVIP